VCGQDKTIVSNSTYQLRIWDGGAAEEVSLGDEEEQARCCSPVQRLPNATTAMIVLGAQLLVLWFLSVSPQCSRRRSCEIFPTICLFPNG
jgi:hypothetical protein